jgi:hypothetical protein
MSTYCILSCIQQAVEYLERKKYPVSLLANNDGTWQVIYDEKPIGTMVSSSTRPNKFAFTTSKEQIHPEVLRSISYKLTES